MTYDLLSRALRDTAARGDLALPRAFANAGHPADMANFLGGLTPEDAWVVLRLMPLAEQAELFGYFGVEFQVELIAAGARPEVDALVGEMNADARADLFNALPRPAREALPPALARVEHGDLRRLAAMPEGAASHRARIARLLALVFGGGFFRGRDRLFRAHPRGPSGAGGRPAAADRVGRRRVRPVGDADGAGAGHRGRADGRPGPDDRAPGGRAAGDLDRRGGGGDDPPDHRRGAAVPRDPWGAGATTGAAARRGGRPREATGAAGAQGDRA